MYRSRLVGGIGGGVWCEKGSTTEGERLYDGLYWIVQITGRITVVAYPGNLGWQRACCVVARPSRRWRWWGLVRCRRWRALSNWNYAGNKPEEAARVMGEGRREG